MATTAAQDEFNELMRDKSRLKNHPADSVTDNSDAASFLNDDSSGDERTTSRVLGRRDKRSRAQGSTRQSPHSTQQGHYTVPTQRHQSNTGPKGVITDAQAYRDAARSHGRPKETNRQRSFQDEREAQIAGTQPYIPSGLGQQQQQQQQYGDGRGSRESRTQRAVDSDEEELCESTTDADHGFMGKWRRDRLRQLQGQQGRNAGPGAAGSAGRDRAGRRLHFGGLVPVDGPGYLEVIEGSGDETVVVVLIYDDQSEVSQLIEACVSSLARKWINTRFIKLHYRDAEMEPAGVPAVLAYKGADKFAGLVPVFNEIPDDAHVDAETLEKLFQRHQIL